MEDKEFLFNSFQLVLLKYLESSHFPERMSSESWVEWKRRATARPLTVSQALLGCHQGQACEA